MSKRSLLVIAILLAVIIPAAGADDSRTVKDEINDSELLANMQGSWPKSLSACERALDIAAGCITSDPVRAVRLYEAAVKAYLFYLNSHNIRAKFKLALQNAPQELRDAFYESGPGLYLDAKYKEYVEKHPKGFYAPYAHYCAIAGYKTYFIDWNSDDPRANRKLVIADPDSEIKAWPEYIRKYPTFQSCDDANYRLGRALEKKKMLIPACLQFRIKHPNGDMAYHSLERIQFIMETMMDAETIMEVLDMAQKEERDPRILLINDSELKSLCSYLCAMKFYYARSFQKAAEAFANVARLPVGTSEFCMSIRRQAAERAKFSSEAAALAKLNTAEGLYKYASHIYKNAGRTFTANVVRSPASRSSYYAAEPKEFFPLRTRFWQSAQVYHQILEEYPYSGVIPKALFMLGNCYCHLAEKSDPFWRPRMRENVKISVFYFEKVAERHPYHELAPAARKAADTLKKNWRLN